MSDKDQFPKVLMGRKLQPSNATGRGLRLAMMPVTLIVAFSVVYFILKLLAKISSTDIQGLLRPDDASWPILVFLPSAGFGIVLGLMTLNLIAFCIPPLRRIFDSEVAQTGRHSFAKAMKDLSKCAVGAGVITLIGAILFLCGR